VTSKTALPHRLDASTICSSKCPTSIAAGSSLMFAATSTRPPSTQHSLPARRSTALASGSSGSTCSMASLRTQRPAFLKRRSNCSARARATRPSGSRSPSHAHKRHWPPLPRPGAYSLKGLYDYVFDERVRKAAIATAGEALLELQVRAADDDRDASLDALRLKNAINYEATIAAQYTKKERSGVNRTDRDRARPVR